MHALCYATNKLILPSRSGFIIFFPIVFTEMGKWPLGKRGEELVVI